MTYLTAEEVAARLRVHVKVVYRWREKRTGPPCMRVNRRYLYPLPELEAWEASRMLDMPGEMATG